MSSGLVVRIKFDNDFAEDRFIKWLRKGNQKSETLGVGNLGLYAKALKISNREYIFFYGHFFILNVAWLLRLSLWVQFKRLRKFVHISRVSKLDLMEILFNMNEENLIK